MRQRNDLGGLPLAGGTQIRPTCNKTRPVAHSSLELLASSPTPAAFGEPHGHSLRLSNQPPSQEFAGRIQRLLDASLWLANPSLPAFRSSGSRSLDRVPTGTQVTSHNGTGYVTVRSGISSSRPDLTSPALCESPSKSHRQCYDRPNSSQADQPRPPWSILCGNMASSSRTSAQLADRSTSSTWSRSGWMTWNKTLRR